MGGGSLQLGDHDLAHAQHGVHRGLGATGVGVAFVLFVLAVTGAVYLLARDRALAAVVLSVPVLYLAYMSTQRVMIVRNYLIVAPFFAYLVARGASAIAAAAPYRGARVVLASVLVAALTASAVWQIRAATSVGGREPEVFARDVAAYLEGTPLRVLNPT